jgi:peroxiredoxin
MGHITSGHTAPDFTLRTLDGQEVSLHGLLEHGTVVAAFFKISCPVCQFTFPFLERMHSRAKNAGVSFLGISQNDATATRAFCREYGVTFPVVMDEKGYPVSNAYGLTNVPTIYLIGPDGKIEIDSTGFEKETLEKIAKSLAAAQAAAASPLFLPHEEVPAFRPG